MCDVTALGKLVPQKILFDLFAGYSCTSCYKGKKSPAKSVEPMQWINQRRKNPFFVFLSLPALHYWPACICLCEPIKSVLLIATNCLTQLACVLIQKSAKLCSSSRAVGCAVCRTEQNRKIVHLFPHSMVSFIQKVTKVAFIPAQYLQLLSWKSAWKMCLKRP